MTDLFDLPPPAPEGFAYRADLITPDEEADLIARLAGLPFEPFQFHGYEGRRRVVIVDEADIHGDGVNVAARLEALAQPGGICISAAAHDQVRGKLDVAFEEFDTGMLAPPHRD